MPESQDDNVIHFLASTVESMGDRMETGFARLETRFDALETRMGRLETGMDAGFAAVRGDIEQVHIGIDTIERLISARLITPSPYPM